MSEFVEGNDFVLKNPALADDGAKKIAWAELHMPVLMSIRKRFEKEKPLKGVRIAGCLHVTKETAVLARTLVAGGAELRLCASNPLSTQDDVAAALAKEGIPTFAVKGMGNELYYKCLNKALDVLPHITLDDGADLVNTIHSKRTQLMKDVVAGQEETTTGVIRLRAMAKDGALKYPVIAVNDTPTKHFFDNRYGTGQSTIDGVIRATSELLAGKVFVVAGYGWCGRGLAMRARGMGSKVVVTEVEEVKALEAHMDGFDIMPMKKAAKIGDIFVTATGDCDVLTAEHFELMKDGAVVANTGHFDVEINVPDLKKLSKNVREIKPEVEEYTLKDGRRIILLAQGRLVNLACAEGHPPEVMDMSFSDQALCSEWIAKNRGKIPKGVMDVPPEIDLHVAQIKLSALGVEIDKLSARQKEYLNSWQEGT
ncbi:MAG: adenosylhomocysteinase [Candidatus Micrarchaeia archaeon]